MEKLIKSVILILLMCEFSSCVGTGGQKTFAPFDRSRQSGNDSADREFNRLTRNGTTIPSGEEVARVVSNPGDINPNVDCPPAEPEPEVRRSSSGRSPFRSNGMAGPYGISLKNHPRPERGCYPVENVSLDQAKQALRSQNFTIRAESSSRDRSPSNAEVRTLGAAVLSMQYLNGGVFTIGKPNRPIPFMMCDKKDLSSQQLGPTRSNPQGSFRISRKGGAQHGLSVAQYVHEWSHRIGNSQMPGAGRTVYSEFLRVVGGKVWTEDSRSGQKGCLVSRYADNRSNEHFAEVFTAFVTEPKLLKEMGKTNPVCRKAYEFFEKRLFKNGERARECY